MEQDARLSQDAESTLSFPQQNVSKPSISPNSSEHSSESGRQSQDTNETDTSRTQRTQGPSLLFQMVHDMQQVQTARTHTQETSVDFQEIRECQIRNRSLLSEVITSLDHMVKRMEQEQSFPEFERFMQLKVRHGRCLLCRERLRGQPNWHFDSLHFDHFLAWLEVQDRKLKRRKLVAHAKKRRSLPD